MSTVWLTTPDNPYDPATDWDAWYAYDITQGYNTCGYVARICHTSDDLSYADQVLDVEDAVEEILRINGPEMYVKTYI